MFYPGNIAINTELNQLRQQASYGLDIRIDKVHQINKKGQIKWYIDLLDILQSKVNGPPLIYIPKDSNNNPITNPNNPEVYEYKTIQNDLATFIPTFGIVFTH